MNQPVLLKGNSLGLTMVLDPGMKFDQLIKAIEDKFVQAKDFFNGQTQIALKIEGRKMPKNFRMYCRSLQKKQL